MAILGFCCFCVSLRTASLAFGIFTFVYSSALLAAASLHVNEPPLDTNVLLITIAMMLCYGLCVISSVLLFIGLCVESKSMLLPWLVCVPLAGVLTIPFNEINQVKEGENGLVILSLDAAFLLVEVYGVFVVMSQYQEYSDGRGTADHSNRLKLMSNANMKNLDLEKGLKSKSTVFAENTKEVPFTRKVSQSSDDSNGNVRDKLVLMNSSKEALFTVEKFGAKENTPLIVDIPKKPSQVAKP